MFKKIMAIILIFTMSFLLIGCKKDPVGEKIPDAPKNLVISQENISWGKAKNATGYIVFINGDEYFVEGTSFNLNKTYMEDGVYEIFVRSVNGKTRSTEKSTTINHSVNRTAQRESLFESLLKNYNDIFIPGMTEEDFDDEWWLYSEYEATVKEMERLSIALAASGIVVSQVDAMTNAMDAIDEIDTSESGSLILVKNQLDILRNIGLTPDQLAYFLLSYASMMIEIPLEEQEEYDYLSEDELEMYLMIQQLMVEEKQVVVRGLRTTISFMFDFYDGIEAAMLTSLETIKNSEEFNTAEFVVLKNELVAMMTELIPTLENFENIYSVLGIITGKYLNLEKSDWDNLVQESAILSKNAFTVGLLFVGDIDVATINELKEMVETASGSMDSMPTVLVEVGMYLVNYADDFYEKNKTFIDALPGINEEIIKPEIYNILKSLVLKIMKAELSLEDFTYYSTFVEKFFANIKDFEDALELVVDKGKDEVMFLIENNGIFLEFVLANFAPLQDEIDKARLTEIFNQLLEFNNFAFGDHQKADLEIILKGFKVPMELALKEMLQLERTFDAAAEINIILPYITTVLHNVITLENQFMEFIDEQNMVEAILGIHDFTSDTEVTDEETVKIAEVIIKKVSLFFSETRETLVNNTIEILFNDIFSREIFLDFTGMNAESMEIQKSDIIEAFDGAIEQLDIMAGYNFKNLTPEQEEEILDMFSIFDSSYPSGKEVW